ncbi:MAG: COX15/CtaA family protein [Myxococcota bacterium]|nr:COX15/CtaA family protein [Myxococcota bacterium]
MNLDLKRPATPNVGRWLLVVFGSIAVMVIIGGLTRLTQSGLSMVTWRPVTGWLPPLGDAAWDAAFEQYKAFPQYQKMNQAMTLPEFKFIFFWEYLHRLWGRIIGLLFFVPWVYFAIRGRMTRRFMGLTFIGFCLGGLQGAVGWWMVKSGLIDNPAVSHYRLAVHLGLALTCAMYVLWLALNVFPGDARQRDRGGQRWTIAFLVLVSVQIIYGAFMAGTKAGYMYQSFPLFNGQFFPQNGYIASMGAANLVENLDMLNFVHRTLGWGVAFFGIYLTVKLMRSVKTPHQRRRLLWIRGLVAAQFALGVSVVLVPGVPPLLGAAHQIGAFALLATTVALLHSYRGVESRTA